eukprot:361440_1
MDKNNQDYQVKGKLQHKTTHITEFTVKYKVKGEQNESSVLYHHQSRTFCHIISDIITDSLMDDKDVSEGHDDEIQGDMLIPRRVAFIIDQSYSMHGPKWTKTISSTVQALNQLRPNHDRYSIIFFDQNMKQYTRNTMVLATQENIANAISFVQKETLGGATDINTPLLHGIELIKNDIRVLNGQKSGFVDFSNKKETDELNELFQIMDVEIDSVQPQNDNVPPKMAIEDVATKDGYNFYMNQIILITDGEPNNGVTDTSKILLNVAKANNLKGLDAYSNKISIFSFGVGTDRNDSSWTTDLNHSFLKLLSVNNQGLYKRIKETNCDTQLAEHYKILSTPVLTNIEIKYDNYFVNNLTNTSFNALFHGNDIIIGGQCTDDKTLDSVEVNISAITGKSIKQNDKYITKPIHIKKRLVMNIPRDDDAKDEGNENNTERIWAYLKLQQCAKQKLIHNDMIEMDDEEEKERDALPMLLAMKYKFVTPWTSMIVVKEKEGNQKKKKKKKQSEMSQEVQIFKDERAFDYVGADPNAALSDGTYYHMVDLTQNPIHSRSASQSDAPQVATVFSQTEPLGTKEIRSGVDQSDEKEREMDLDKCDELMEDINEAMNVNEMNEAMSQPLGVMMDDDELEAELAELEELEADELLDEIGDVIGNYHALGTEQKFEVDPVYSTFIKMKKTTVDPQQQQFSVLSHDANHFQGFTFEGPKKSKANVSDLFDLPSPPSRPIASQSEEDSELAELEAMMSSAITTIAYDSRIQTQSEEKKEDVIKKVFEAYDNEDIRITFECIESSKASGLCRILATFYNKSQEEITDFKFTVKVDAHINLTIKSANGTKLLASSQNSITQQFESVNTKYGEQPFVIDFEVSFTKDSTEIILKSSVKIPDYFV